MLHPPDFVWTVELGVPLPVWLETVDVAVLEAIEPAEDAVVESCDVWGEVATTPWQSLDRQEDMTETSIESILGPCKPAMHCEPLVECVGQRHWRLVVHAVEAIIIFTHWETQVAVGFGPSQAHKTTPTSLATVAFTVAIHELHAESLNKTVGQGQWRAFEQT
jgi:hypothetical protein